MTILNVGRYAHHHILMVMILAPLFMNKANGQQLFGTIDPSTQAATTFLGIDGNISRVTAIGDIDGNGFTDLAFKNLNDASIYTAYSDAAMPSVIDLNNVSGAGGNDAVLGAVYRGDPTAGLTQDERFRISSAGDINGDGYADLVVGQSLKQPVFSNGFPPPNLGMWMGEAYLIYGGSGANSAAPSGEIILTNVGTANGPHGARFFGATQDDWLGSAVAAAGDVNGDGIDDLLLSANAVEHPYNQGGCLENAAGEGCFAEDTGFTYLIYGKSSTSGEEISGIYSSDGVASDATEPFLAPIYDGFLSPEQFPIENYPQFYVRPLDGAVLIGTTEAEGFGHNIAGGDINGDGLSDLVIGSGGGFSIDDPRAAYVVMGQPEGSSSKLRGILNAEAIGEANVIDEYRPIGSAEPQQLSPIEGAVFQGGSLGEINGQTELSLSGAAISILGDVNGDGINDFSLGNSLVFGQPGEGLMDEGQVLQDVPGIPLPGQTRDDRVIQTGRIGINTQGVDTVAGLQFSSEITPAGDINGDGLADFIVGNNLVYGQLDTDLSQLIDPATGETVWNVSDLDMLGAGFDGIIFPGSGQLFSAEDVNADGLADLVFNAPGSGGNGESYLIYGVSNIIGDLNGDGMVDMDDFNIVVANFGETVTPGVWGLGDIVPNGLVDEDDFNLVVLNFGSGTNSVATAVPEPTTMFLGIFCSLGIYLVHRSCAHLILGMTLPTKESSST